eukprot:Nitzschia sp. Nitz4//scaffold290_size23356//8560//9821//NITZ4_008488-RA/size23356-processed-gene-0.26-mRNA-1//-1//CDS//3329546093//8588//frame0
MELADDANKEGDAEPSRLSFAFQSLNEKDQYDAVVTSLCERVMNQGNVSALNEPLELVEEMNRRHIQAKYRTLTTLIDASTTLEDPKEMSHVMRVLVGTGATKEYGLLGRDISPFPVLQSKKERHRMVLDSLKDVPSDNRHMEMTSALALAGAIVMCWVVPSLGDCTTLSPYIYVVWPMIVAFFALDNFYELITGGMSLLSDEFAQKLPPILPLGIGSGGTTKAILRGFQRLGPIDVERDCYCDAAAIVVAYGIGLPFYSFRPNGLEAAVIVAESADPKNRHKYSRSLLTRDGILRILVWMMAPVVAEQGRYGHTINSNPREAELFLQRLEFTNLFPKKDIWWLDQEGLLCRSDLLKWACQEASQLVEHHEWRISDVAKRLSTNSATIGDCVAAMEEWYE